jgi:ABC-type sugar transport system permease subunit
MLTGSSFMPLANTRYSIFAVISHEYWRSFPFAMLFIAAGLTTISREIYEAATIDGAGKWRQFQLITLPLLKSHLFIVILMTTNTALQSSEVIYSLTRGGPGYSTETIAVRMFKDAFVYFDANTGAAISVFLLLIATVLMFAYSRLMLVREDDAGE